MRYVWLPLSLSIFYACAGSNFKSSPSSASTPAAATSETLNQVAQTSTETMAAGKEPIETVPTDTDTLAKECLLATGGEQTSVVSISQGNIDLSGVTPNSVLLLEVQGKAQIKLSSTQISSLKGICIFAAGEASVELDLNATVLAMYYYSRGNSVSKFNFGPAGTLAKLVTNSSGGSQLQLTGQKLACDSLKLPVNGSAKVTCNGALL